MKRLSILLVLIFFYQISLSQAPCPPVGGDNSGGHGMPGKLIPVDPNCEECLKKCEPGIPLTRNETGAYFCVQVVEAKDPNDIIGPRGYGEKRWVSVMDTLDYTIRYENDPKFATAPARNVVIDHAFDKNVDSTSFRLGTFGFGNLAFLIPGQRTYYSTRLDVIDTLGVMVDVSAGLIVTENKTRWEFISVNPLTGLNFIDALAGFLPINDSTHQGEGFTTFSVLPKDNLKTGDTVYAEASIVFDDNEAIVTNGYVNTIDADAPESVISSIEMLNDSTVEIQTFSSDVGSGFHHLELYSNNSNIYSLVGSSGASGATFSFTGSKDSTYCFLTIAVDSVGNTEVKQKKSPCIVLDTIPHIFDFDPKRGIPLTEVTIVGWNFTEIESVQFDGKEAEYTSNDSDTIVATAPYPGETGYITVKTATGMAISDSVFTYEDPTGLEADQNVTIRISPNSTHGIFKIDTPAELLPEGRLFVYDMKGLIIKEFDLTQMRKKEIIVDISHVPGGIYIVRLIGNKSYATRVLKQ